jgi:hypothetical protein
MRILLIGNFGPRYEEESLHNISFMKKLESDGHKCTVINTSEIPATENNFIETKSFFNFLTTLIKACWNQDVVHFSTKGYLRMGLLKLMIAIFVGTLFRARTFITIHSELFSIQGQLRSSLGGRQTLFASFKMADKIICADRDTYDVAAMYMKKSNFVLAPSFIHFPDEIMQGGEGMLEKLKAREKVIVFSNVVFPSFTFEILNKFLTDYPIPSDTAIVVAVTDKPTSQVKHLLENGRNKIGSNLHLIDADDLNSVMAAHSRADIILRPLSCEGSTYFEPFSLSVKKTLRSGNYLYFPNGLLFIKEGDTSEMCACIINTLLCVDSGQLPEITERDSYTKIVDLYQGKD